MKQLFILLIGISSLNIFSQNIVVDDTRTAQDLVQNILFNNSGCATISNFSVTGGDFGTGENSYAYFNGNSSIFPFEEGVVLSTGRANHTIGPNTSLSDDQGIGWGTDTDLDAIFSNTLNATVLEFDFVPISSYMSFDYIFASEEYQEGDNSTCQYSDVFAFLIKAAGDPNYTNIAVIPNTTIPVQVTTVHSEISGGCSAENESYFGSWNNASAPINFNGQTAVLTAGSAVVAGQTYHIKLVIADHTNYRYDSAVFIKAGSFNIGANLGIDILRSTGNALCGVETVTLDANNIGAISYIWTVDTLPYDGVFVPIAGANNPTYVVSSQGIYKVIVDLGGGCLSEGEIIVEYGTPPLIFDVNLVRCNDGSSNFAEFDLTEATAFGTSVIFENYYENYADAVSEINEIQAPESYTNTSQNQTITARIRNQDGCVAYISIYLNVYSNPIIKGDETAYYCIDTYPDTIILDGGILYDNPNNYQYQWFFDNGIDPIIDLSINAPTIAINTKGNYIVEITSGDNCTVTRAIIVEESSTAIIEEILISDIAYSNRVSLIVTVEGAGEYEYALDDYNYQDSNVFEGVLYGYHVVTVRDKNGCIPNAQETVIVLEYPKFLTPNNDGNYDTWNINNVNTTVKFNTISAITIYDRYGKIIKVIDSNSVGWNGRYNNAPAPPADYWFTVKLKDYKGKTILKRGHFSLVR